MAAVTVVLMAGTAVGGCGSSKPAAACGPGLYAAVEKALDKGHDSGANEMRDLGARLRKEATTMDPAKQRTLTTFAGDLDDMAAFLTQPNTEKPTFKFFFDEDAADAACGAPVPTPTAAPTPTTAQS